MTVTLKLHPETQAGLLVLAHDRGVSVEDYLVAMVESTVSPERSNALSPEAKAALWRETAKHFPDTPPLCNDAISRDSMYADRG